jgi:hypothetical protein
MMFTGLRAVAPGRGSAPSVRIAANSPFVRSVLCLILFSWWSGFHPPTCKPAYAGSALSPEQEVSQLSPSAYLTSGEELLYRVSYWFIGLGEIRVRVVDKVQENGKTTYRAEVEIDSYGGNPFVNLHEYYETRFDSTLYPYRFYGRWLDGDRWRYVIYDFRYDVNKVFVEKGRYDLQTIEGYDTVDINRKYQDGLSLFYFARGFVKSGEKLIVPTFIQEKKGKTFFDFSGEATEKEIDSVSYPIDVVEFEGEADWVGIFGLTGRFRGWFSNDEARIPIVARMKVIIGSVRVELKSWKREGWIPPKYVEVD